MNARGLWYVGSRGRNVETTTDTHQTLSQLFTLLLSQNTFDSLVYREMLKLLDFFFKPGESQSKLLVQLMGLACLITSVQPGCILRGSRATRDERNRGEIG